MTTQTSSRNRNACQSSATSCARGIFADADAHQEIDAPERQRNPRRAAGQRQQQALGQELTDETQRPGAERTARDDLLRTRRRARQEQVRDVRARRREHERDGSEQEPQRTMHRPEDFLGERRDLHARSAVLGRRRGVLTLLDQEQLLRGGAHVYAGLQPADDTPAPARGIVRHPHVGA